MTITVGELFIRITTGILWDLRVSVPELVHSNGTQYDHGPSISDLLHRMRDQFLAPGATPHSPLTLPIPNLVCGHLPILPNLACP